MFWCFRWWSYWRNQVWYFITLPHTRKNTYYHYIIILLLHTDGKMLLFNNECGTEKGRTGQCKGDMSFNRSSLFSSCNLWGLCLDAKRGCAKSQRLGLFTQSCIQTVSRYHAHTPSHPSWPSVCWLRSASVHVHNYSTWAGRRDWGQGKVISACLDLFFVFCIWDTVDWFCFNGLISVLTFKMALIFWQAPLTPFVSAREVILGVVCLSVCLSVS